MGLSVISHIEQIEKKSYVSGDFKLNDVDGLMDCSLGINPFGFSERVSWKEKLNKRFINSYPQYPYNNLKKGICDYWKKQVHIGEENVILGNGSIEILYKISELIVGSKDRALGYCPQFTDFVNCISIHGGEYEYVSLEEEEKMKFDAERFISKISSQYKVLYIDNPNNPTGQVIDISKIKSIIEIAKEKGIWTIVDEAYGDFMDKNNSAINLLDDNENLIVVRSFSKGFGLAGLRIGYALCSECFSGYYEKVNMPFALNSFADHAATMALSDELFLENSISKIKMNKIEIINSLKKIDVMETDIKVPIMTLKYPDQKVDFKMLLVENGVLTESGADFHNLGGDYVRLRVPKEPYELMRILGEIEDEI